VSRVTNDTEAVKSLYIQVLFVLLNSGIILLAAMVAMAWLDWRLMLFVASMIPVVIAMVWLYQYLSAPAVSNSRKLRSDINAQMAESLGGMGILQALNAVKQFKDVFSSTNHSHYLARVQVQNANAWLLRPALDLLNVVLLILVIFSFSRRPLNGMEVGLLYAFVSYISHIIDPLIQITTQFGQLQQSVVAAARVHQLLEEKATRPIENAAVVTKGSISIRNLKFGYAPDNLVIQNLSLEIPPGTFIGIAGKTGSGKSTLLNLLLRFYPPQSGHIEFGGASLDAISEAAFRAHVGLVPQDPFLMAATVRENISMGRDISDQEIEKAGRASKAHKFISALEKGYDTPLGEGGSRLSTGQKQLIAIARALAGQPKILFLDEATSHIDSETSKSIQSALHELHGKVTIVAIAHRLSTIRHADNIVIINHGTIAETGTHENLMHHADGIYRKLYLLQQMGE
jgi:ATP-binding cassette subfamily B protein/ATP-binding cassette subfamily C protein/ATP-binding cassette subfamily B multidrug efflux pump